MSNSVKKSIKFGVVWRISDAPLYAAPTFSIKLITVSYVFIRNLLYELTIQNTGS